MTDEPQIQDEIEEKQPEATDKEKKTLVKESEKESPLIKGAINAAERLEKATEEMNKVVKKAEEIAVENALGGRSFGGEEIKPKIDTPEEYANKILNGEVNPLKIDEN